MKPASLFHWLARFCEFSSSLEKANKQARPSFSSKDGRHFACGSLMFRLLRHWGQKLSLFMFVGALTEWAASNSSDKQRPRQELREALRKRETEKATLVCSKLCSAHIASCTCSPWRHMMMARRGHLQLGVTQPRLENIWWSIVADCRSSFVSQFRRGQRKGPQRHRRRSGLPSALSHCVNFVQFVVVATIRSC